MSKRTRRWSLGLVASALAVSVAIRVHGAQTVLPSGLFSHDQLTPRASGSTEIRQMMTGDTHSGYRVDLHETALAAGQMPHAPHHHVHEEMILIREGTLEVTVKGRTERLGPGSAIYIASNEEHGWKNVGTSPAKYFVVALGEDK
jgi:quercetin dioxygenase-like cupin family protein